MSDEHRSPITGALHLARTDEEAGNGRPGRWRELWQRIGHIYRTRVRTTTVLLVVAWLAGLVLYMFTANHYGVIPAPPNQQRPVVTTPVVPTETPTPEPTATTESVEPSAEPDGSAASPSSRTPSPGSSPEDGGVLDRLTSPLRPAPTTTTTGGAVPSA